MNASEKTDLRLRLRQLADDPSWMVEKDAVADTMDALATLAERLDGIESIERLRVVIWCVLAIAPDMAG